LSPFQDSNRLQRPRRARPERSTRLPKRRSSQYSRNNHAERKAARVAERLMCLPVAFQHAACAFRAAALRLDLRRSIPRHIRPAAATRAVIGNRPQSFANPTVSHPAHDQSSSFATCQPHYCRKPAASRGWLLESTDSPRIATHGFGRLTPIEFRVLDSPSG